MKKRAITMFILLFILLPVVIVPALIDVLQVLLIGVVIGASVELLNMYDKEKKIPLFMKIITIALTLILYCSIVCYFHNPIYNGLARSSLVYRWFGDLFKIINPVVATTIAFCIVGSLLVLVPSMTIHDIGKLFVQIFYVAVGTSTFTIIRLFGVRFIFYLLLITILTDTFAYLSGRFFGKHKMAPVTSPKKTWEGAIGGTIVAVIVSVSFTIIYPYVSKITSMISPQEYYEISSFYTNMSNIGNWNQAAQIVFTVFLTLSMSIFSQIGDLFASKLKRYYGIKDYSNIFPGHGGLLDRFDSALFASAIFLVFMLVSIGI